MFRRVFPLMFLFVANVVFADDPIKEGANFHIYDGSGKPIEGVSIDVVEWTGTYEPTDLRVQTDKQGHAKLPEWPKDGMYYAHVSAPDYVTASIQLDFNQPKEREVELTLEKPVRCSIEVFDPEGQPISGAELQHISYVDTNGNQVYLTKKLAPCFDCEWAASDGDGRLQLPPIPKAVELTLSVIHPDWHSNVLTSLQSASGNVGSITLKPGVLVEVELQLADQSGPMPDSILDVLMFPRQGGSRGAGAVTHRFTSRNGKLRFTAGEQDFSELRISNEDHFIGPMILNFPESPVPSLSLSDGKARLLKLTAYPKKPVRGKIVDAKGQPVAGAMVSGVLVKANESHENLSGKAKWMARVNATTGAGFTSSDDQGNYEIMLANGHAELEVIHPGFFATPESMKVDVLESGETKLPDFIVQKVPDLIGQVINQKGEPVKGMIVQMKSPGRAVAAPFALSDKKGGFKLKMRRIPYNESSDGLTKTVSVAAMDPNRNVGGVTVVEVADPEQTSKVTVQLEDQELDWFSQVAAGKVVPEELAKRQEFVRKIAADMSDATPGNAFPQMTEGTWLNTEAKSLQDFQGRFVLLDFWFIGCGPCVREMPQLKVAQRGFDPKKFVIVSVHNNSANADRVRGFANKNKMTYPIVVDNASGSIIKECKRLGLRGYPHYVLLDPAGKIYHNDGLMMRSLRGEKFEIIHRALQEWDWTDNEEEK